MSKMDIDSFVENFAAILDDTDPSTITAETVFRDIEEWSSLTALSLMAMVDEEYDLKITGNEIRSSKTVADLFEHVSAKVA